MVATKRMAIKVRATPKTLGNAMRLTPEQTSDAAHVTALDMQAARLAWKRYAPLRLKTLLDAR